MRFLASIFASALLVGSAVAQTVLPFTLDGPFDDATVDTTDFNSGGKLFILGHTVTIPKNLIVQFPAAWVTFKDFAEAKGSMIGYELLVTGNFVNNVPIAGMIEISQHLTGGGAGVIESVNQDGTIKIAGGPTLRINTPGGVFAKAYTDSPMFTSDEANPSIMSFSGFPMCIPRSNNDPDCPASNRPANGARAFRAPNPMLMAPFIPGDYITYAGIKRGGEYLCFEIVAENVQITTSGDAGEPVFVRVEDVLIGVFDGSGNTEFADTRYIGYVSDPTATVTVHAIEIDPCTGVETERQVASGPLKAGDVRNKFVIRFTDTVATRATREYRIKASKGAKTTTNGIEAGQYVSPVTEVIWPENNVPGTPWPQNAFNQFSHLANGFVMDDKQFGPLSPWPGAAAPTPSKVCTGHELDEPVVPSGALPVADAGVDQLLIPGTLVTLTAANTNVDLGNAALTFAWRQTLPTTENIALTGANTKTVTFTTPLQTASQAIITREFEVKVCRADDATKCATDRVKVVTDRAQKDIVKITSYQYVNSNNGRITVAAESNVVLLGTQGARLQIFLNNEATGRAMTEDSAGKFSYTVRSLGRQPTQIRVTSSYGGSETRTALLRRDRRRISRIEARVDEASL